MKWVMSPKLTLEKYTKSYKLYFYYKKSTMAVTVVGFDVGHDIPTRVNGRVGLN